MSTDGWIAMYERSVQSAIDNTDDRKALKELHLAVEAILKAGLNEHPHCRVPRGHDTPVYARRLDVPKRFRPTITYLESVYRRRYPDDVSYPVRDCDDVLESVKEIRNWVDNHYL